MTGNDDMEALLAGYADGELDDADMRRVEAWLAEDPEAREMLRVHRETTALLRAAYPESLFAGAAPAIGSKAGMNVRMNVPPGSRAAASRPLLRWDIASRPVVRWAAAAVIAAGILGYGAGAMWPGPLRAERPALLAELARDHAVYARESVHLVEAPASQPEHVKTWLGKRVNRALTIPDLGKAGLTFAGGRLVVLDGAPVAELMYTRPSGPPIALCIMRHEGASAALTMYRQGAVNLAAWSDGTHTYAVVGEADPETIRQLAVDARGQM